MKRVKLLIAGLFFILTTLNLMAQDKTGIDFYQGKWSVVAQGPNGDLKMIIEFNQKEGKVVSAISDTDGKELFKVVSTEVKGNSASLNFIGSQGSEVPMEIQKKDNDHFSGTIMSMYDFAGERLK